MREYRLFNAIKMYNLFYDLFFKGFTQQHQKIFFDSRIDITFLIPHIFSTEDDTIKT